ncbi:MAG: helix-turn-helix transcriptional regulator [Bacillota bacterium]
MNKSMNLGEKLRFYRERKKLYQQDVASFLEVTQQTISHYEKGRIVPDLETLVKLAQLYEVNLNELYSIDSYAGSTANFTKTTSIDASQKEQFLYGERIKRRRIERHLSQEDLAKIMDQTIDSIANWESTNIPTGKITYAFANRLAMVLQSPLSWLMGMSESPWFVPPLPETAYFGHSVAKTPNETVPIDNYEDEAELLNSWVQDISQLTPGRREKRVALTKIALEMVREVERLYCQDDHPKGSK